MFFRKTDKEKQNDIMNGYNADKQKNVGMLPDETVKEINERLHLNLPTYEEFKDMMKNHETFKLGGEEEDPP